DDGSHKSSDIILSFLLHFPKVRNGGVCIVADLHCSYFEQYEGGLFHPHTSMAFFKLLADAINIEHWGVNKTRRDLLSRLADHYPIELDEEELSKVFSVPCSHSMCVIRKRGLDQWSRGRRFVGGSEELVTSIDRA